VAEPDLGRLIDLQITANGPMSVASFMALCLTHPRHGYYKKADPLGAAGDFITAPEISQMFGELIGFWLVNLWQQMREPPAITVLELGPGRGTLMDDALRVASRAEGFTDALHLQLFETNPALRAEQLKRLGKYHPYWADEIDTVGDGPVLIVANEFFDALPIRQFVRGATGWHERLVGLRDGERAFGLSPNPIPTESLPSAVHDAPEGAVYEANLAASETMARLSRLIARQGGGMLAIDYGYAATRTGETLQAVSRHAFADVLNAPGTADLSAHVDFGALSETATAAGLTAHPVVAQGAFLRHLGIVERADALSRANPALAPTIEAALTRLTAPDQMGELFKVLAVTSPGLIPIGLAAP
jgi:NADH dehydrogenase [ubiquinone] 1 alpha subcomplex assembly factor 7